MYNGAQDISNNTFTPSPGPQRAKGNAPRTTAGVEGAAVHSVLTAGKAQESEWLLRVGEDAKP